MFLVFWPWSLWGNDPFFETIVFEHIEVLCIFFTTSWRIIPVRTWLLPISRVVEGQYSPSKWPKFMAYKRVFLTTYDTWEPILQVIPQFGIKSSPNSHFFLAGLPKKKITDFQDLSGFSKIWMVFPRFEWFFQDLNGFSKIWMVFPRFEWFFQDLNGFSKIWSVAFPRYEWFFQDLSGFSKILVFFPRFWVVFPRFECFFQDLSGFSKIWVVFLWVFSYF